MAGESGRRAKSAVAAVGEAEVIPDYRRREAVGRRNAWTSAFRRGEGNFIFNSTK
jgi:hypothetical protein